VALGLASKLEEAQALIMAREILVKGQVTSKASEMVSPEDAVTRKAKEHPYVGRGGMKLAAALEHFKIKVTGFVCLDVGASTGGFTDCLLKNGAARVAAVDSGHGQLDWTLRQDPRVLNLEKTNAKNLLAGNFPSLFDFLCMDVSFISSARLLPVLAPLLKPGAAWVVLVKPQFEAKTREVGPGGIVTNETVRQRVCQEVIRAAEELNMGPIGLIPSPIQGADGNVEFLVSGRLSKTL
jgi:23S rRNA (cytidine1920-2'-O)/16S rRNA (cytidine1409-2'-O)-methyltransferase